MTLRRIGKGILIVLLAIVIVALLVLAFEFVRVLVDPSQRA
jgi:hypothetical protein